MRKFIITVNNKTYEVEVEEVGEEVSIPAKKQVAPEASKSAPIAAKVEAKPISQTPVASAGSEVVESPLPGNIWEILVKEGQEVKSGDVLLVLEAMKMENEILSPKDGIVASIATQEGAAVNTGDKLVVID
ncbi:MAG: biotin/lipoyl-binding protein [Tissierellia bacterium]|nr:biotin/lipoyl-binding protein [Tissierellia bacterium]